MLTGLVVFAIVMLIGFPETAVACWIERQITATGTALRRVERKHLIFLALMTAVLVIGAEALAIAGPFDVALVLMWDISVYIDVVVTTVVVATAARTSVGWSAIVAKIAPRRMPRARRRRAARKTESPANDEDRPAFALAA